MTFVTLYNAAGSISPDLLSISTSFSIMFLSILILRAFCLLVPAGGKKKGGGGRWRKERVRGREESVCTCICIYKVELWCS